MIFLNNINSNFSKNFFWMGKKIFTPGTTSGGKELKERECM